jgi:hypothetical protein
MLAHQPCSVSHSEQCKTGELPSPCDYRRAPRFSLCSAILRCRKMRSATSFSR